MILIPGLILSNKDPRTGELWYDRCGWVQTLNIESRVYAFARKHCKHCSTLHAHILPMEGLPGWW